MNEPLTFVVVGATGDLARRKLFPALFACYARGLLPPDVRFVGLARTALDDAAFRLRLADGLKCDELEAGVCSREAGAFLQRCHYCACAYDAVADFRAAGKRLAVLEASRPANRIFYLAVPPFVFDQAAGGLAAAGLLSPANGDGSWTRLVVEKPFGRDRASYDGLQRRLAAACEEGQLFRIDHYLGKEVVQNLLVLRFANAVFEPLWTGAHVHHVHIAWGEQQGIAGRAGYFDQYGIIRDVMQNHLMQILSLIAMERPASRDADAVRDAKARLLRQVEPLALENLVVGQYTAAGADRRDYLQEEGVRPDSRTPTYAAAVLQVRTPRWHGVPFLLTAGKGLGRGVTEVRLHFRHDPGLFSDALPPLPHGAETNELIIRVQPDEQLVLRIVSKVPGAGVRLGLTELDLRFREKYPDVRIADAYENLLLDVVRGERGQFLRDDELAAAWDIFTPALAALETRRIRPVPYEVGSSGPAAVCALAARHGISDATTCQDS
jgi:glucose-6-phosphate 1-dehydrogenase